MTNWYDLSVSLLFVALFFVAVYIFCRKLYCFEMYIQDLEQAEKSDEETIIYFPKRKRKKHKRKKGNHVEGSRTQAFQRGKTDHKGN